MPREVFADNVYWVALLNRADDEHSEAITISQSLAPVRLVTTYEVLTETLNFFCDLGRTPELLPQLRRHVHASVGAILTAPDVEVIPQSEELFQSGLELYGQRPDKGYSLTDCISMSVMKQRGLQEVLTSDHHFEQEGFTLLMRTPATSRQQRHRRRR